MSEFTDKQRNRAISALKTDFEELLHGGTILRAAYEKLKKRMTIFWISLQKYMSSFVKKLTGI